MHSDVVMQYSNNINTKQLTLIILEESIRTKWKMLTQEQQNGIRQYMMNLIITLGKKSPRSNEENHILHRANVILVQIVKYEWTSSWQDFVP